MNIKNLDKAQKFYAEIKKLDSEINQIDKLAKLSVEGGCDMRFSISLETKKDSKEKVLDSDGSLCVPGLDYRPFTFSFSLSGHAEPVLPKQSLNFHEIKEGIDESVFMQMLGVLLMQKTDRRKYLLLKLEELGFKVN